jgi:GT2 family glycosyltransferase
MHADRTPGPEAVTLCIVHHNGADRLLPALRAALARPDELAEVLVVDNASTDGSVQLAQAEFPRLKVLSMARNAGPGSARNAGFAAASHDIILFQDNDVRLEPGCVPTLLATLRERAGALVVAPRVLYEAAPDTIQYDSADCHFLGLMALRNANRQVRHTGSPVARTTSLVTACFLVDRSRWRHGPPFDEDFVFNLEDHEFGVRANLWGYETWVEPGARVLHGGGTPDLSYRPGYKVSAARVFYLLRNRWLVIGKCYSARTLIVLAPVLFLFELFQVAGIARKGWLRQWWLALRSTVRHWPQLRLKRAEVHRSRRAGDGEVLRGGPLPFTDAVKGRRIDRISLAVLAGVAGGYWLLARRLI